MLVVDASVLLPLLAQDGAQRRLVLAHVRGQGLAAPELVDLEVAHALRRLVAAGVVTPPRARVALQDLVDLPVDRVPHRGLLMRCWELRENVTVYDAAYVALAESLRCPLLTADVRLANSPGPRCRFEVLA